MSEGEKNVEANEVCFPFRVENVMDLTKEERLLGEKRINGFPWQFTVFLVNNTLCFRVLCKKSLECPFWECEVKYLFTVINQTDNNFDFVILRGKLIFEFKTDNHCCRYDGLKQLIKNRNPVVDGCIVVEVKLDVKGKSGNRFRKWPQFDFFSPSTFSDAILSVEGKKFHVNKQILAHASSYFETLFFDDSEDIERVEFELENVGAEKFLTLLELIYDGRLLNDNKCSLLMMSRTFGVPRILNFITTKEVHSNLNHVLLRRLEPLSFTDFFSPSKFSDVILSVEGKKFHANKQILAHASPYFETLFFGNFMESQMNEIELKDVVAKEFLPALKLIYDTGMKIDDSNVEYLLMMADMFDIPKIVNCAERWLIDSSSLPLHFKLRLSEQYNLHSSKSKCLRDYICKKGADELMKPDSCKDFSSDLKDDLIKKLAEFVKERSNV